MNKCLALVVLIALISALDSAVLRQRHFVKAENALNAEQKEKPATTDIVDNGNPDKIQGAEDGGPNSDETKSQEKEGTEANSKKTEMPEIRGAEALAQKGTAPLLLKHEMDELIKGETNTRNKRQSGGSARGDKAAEKMPNKFDLTLPKHDPSKSAAKAAEYAPEFDRNNTPVDYDKKEKKCKVEPEIDFMSEELMKILKENGADKRDINAAEDGCGLKGYAEWSRCSKVAFYGRDGYNASIKYGIEKAEPPTKNFNDMDEFDKFGFMHDTVLLLFDGCAVCNGNKVPNVTISLLQHMPTGLLVDECEEFVNQSGKPLKLQMEMVEKQQKSKRSFAYGVSLKERLCVEKKPNTDKAEYFMQKLEYKYRVVLEVNHTCGADGEQKTHYIWLPEIDVFDKETVVGRVMQIRNLKLNLTEMDDNTDFTLILSESDFDKSGQFVNGTLIPYKAESVPRPIPAPKASNIDHLGINCIQIVFADQMPQFLLNVSVFPYFIACEQFEAPFNHETMHNKSPTGDEFFDACQKVPTTPNCDKRYEMIVCYKRKSQTAVANKEIAKICQEHLQIGHQKAHGFRIRLCTHREAEKQRIIVASVLDFSFTDQIHKFNKSFSYKVDAMEETMKRTKLFFIKFGNGMQQSAALSDGKEISAQLSNTIGTILPSIANDGAAGQHRTKQLHFVPPNYELDIFFQTESPIFTRWITRKRNLKAYENDPNKGAPSQCDLLGDDCEPTRELLLQIQDVLQCCSPLNPYKQCLCDGSTNTVDISEFAAPPGEKVPAPPNTTPSSSSSSSSRWAHLGDPLEAGDIMYTKKQAQEKYDHIMEKCSKCVGSTPATEKATKNRSKRQARAGMTKWTKFPIAIRMDPAQIAEADFKQRKEAMRQGMDLIMKDTCITFTLEHNKTEVEGLVVIDKGTSSSYQGMIQRFIWQELSLAENSEGVAGHELLHALGLKHEQNRDDAFYFIKFNPKERATNWMDSFEPVEYTNNYGFPYDYGSVMHYPAAVNPDGYYTMITMGRFYQRTIGKMEKPSFKDLAIINHIYCGDKCKGKKNECQNGGYLNPKQCDECLCPEGYSGASCDYVDEGEGEGCFDSQDTPNNLEADWQIRELNLKVYCVSAEMCSCHWRIKPKKGEKVIIKLNKLNEGALSCGGRCGMKHVEIKYRKDKRAQGALLCCASDILEGNTPRNWIEAEGEDVDIIISVRINTTDVTKLFSLTYETNGAKPMPAKLSPSCDCASPFSLFDQKRNPDFFCENPCSTGSTCNTTLYACQLGFLALNDKVVQNETGPLNVSCHKGGDRAESFWYYWKQKDIEPIRIEEIHCVECHPKRDKGCKYK
ncbi:hypothetical protein niasHT_003637 [Heterodera trifolii]|uniref:Metalloendopeptidase n=1 Tax=Heterodera trifolii TaxID=157864 RepID=A0ABD2MG07_9BILA